MVTLKCVVDGVKFEAKRRDAKYCSERCRKAAYRRDSRRGNRRGTRRESDTDRATDPAPTATLVEVTREALERADQLATPLGVAALRLALWLDHAGDESGSARAAMMKEFRATLGAATAGASKPGGDKVDRLRDEVALKRAQKRGA